MSKLMVQDPPTAHTETSKKTRKDPLACHSKEIASNTTKIIRLIIGSHSCSTDLSHEG